MELGNILEFRKDLYFEGAVQADWFYTPEKAPLLQDSFPCQDTETRLTSPPLS